MTKTFADKLREWTLYEDAHPGNLRGVIREAAEEVDRLTVENERLRSAIQAALDDNGPGNYEDIYMRITESLSKALNP